VSVVGSIATLMMASFIYYYCSIIDFCTRLKYTEILILTILTLKAHIMSKTRIIACKDFVYNLIRKLSSAFRFSYPYRPSLLMICWNTVKRDTFFDLHVRYICWLYAYVNIKCASQMTSKYFIMPNLLDEFF